MSAPRLAWLATATLALLMIITAAADPSGLLGLVGWSGASLWPVSGVWQIAPFIVYAPVALGFTWWSTRVLAGSRRLFGAAFASVLLAILLAKFAMSVVAAGNLAAAAWGSGFTLGKAIPAALIVGGVVALAGRGRIAAQNPDAQRPEAPRPEAESPATEGPARSFWSPSPIWAGALAFGALAPAIAGQWWAGAPYDSWMPGPNPLNGPVPVLGGVAVLVLGAALCQRVFGRRSAGGTAATFLTGWFAALGAGALLGLSATVVGLITDDSFAGDLWPLMATYIRLADGLSYAACLGWIVGLAAVWERSRNARPAREQEAGERETGEREAGTPSGIAQNAVAAGALVLAAIVVSVPFLALPDAAPTQPVTADALAAADAGELLPLRVSGDTITDAADRQVLLRGVNINQLVDFYAPRPEVPSTDPLTEQDFADIAADGFNVVRLGLSWSFLEPERDRYDPAYLEQIRLAVRQAKAHGIYTVLDVHQDGWSAAPSPDGVRCRPGTGPMWGYDGAPDWATITDGAPRCEFTGRDISPAGDRAFNNFYYNTDGIQDQLVKVWAMLADEFKDEPAVAGYDLFNEPNFGETAPITSSLLLGRFFDKSIDAIRGAGAEQIVFFEPSILWSGLGFDSGPPPGFTDDPNIVFSPHLYAESITMDASLGLPTIVGIERGFALAQRVADLHGVPYWSGEYGFWGEDKVENLARFAVAQDANIQGGAYWVWRQACGDPQNGIQEFGDGLQPVLCSTGVDAPRNAAQVEILTRAYPKVAPGRLTSLEADGGRIRMTGRAGEGSCRLEVWFPETTGAGHLQTDGVDDVELAPVPGGMLLTGCATGDYEVSADE